MFAPFKISAGWNTQILALSMYIWSCPERGTFFAINFLALRFLDSDKISIIANCDRLS